MKAYLSILFLVPTIALLLTSFKSVDKGPKPLKIGKTAPLQELKMMDIDGVEKSIGELKSENGLLIVFSCNTCPFVVGTEKFAGWEVQYNNLKVAAEELKIGMTLINSNEAKREKDDSFEAMKTRAKDKAYTMNYLMDSDSKLADAFGAKTTPHVYLFDKDLKLVYSGAIDNTWDTNRTEDIQHLSNALAQMKNTEKITENATTPRGCSIKRKQVQKS